MMIHKIPSSVDYNYWLKLLDTQLNESTNQNSLRSPNLLSQRIRKLIILLVPLSLDIDEENMIKKSRLGSSKKTIFFYLTGGCRALKDNKIIIMFV